MQHRRGREEKKARTKLSEQIRIKKKDPPIGAPRRWTGTIQQRN